MPTVLRRSGPSFERDGKTVEPRAMVHTCEDCGAPASFGKGVDLLRERSGEWFCGWKAGEPVCAAAPSSEGRLV
jgi:hypothetical protein